MRDLVVREAIVEMARDAAKRFRELVAAGEEIPYDVHEAGDGSPLPQYMPMTASFVKAHAPALGELDSFGAACAAIEAGGLAAPYLEDAGVRVPPDARRRAELAGVVFLARLWMDSTDFSLDDERLKAAIAELEANADAAEGEIEVVVPLRGLRMEARSLALATATIARADTVDVPAEARSSEASGGAGYEPTFVAIATVDAAGDADDGAGAGTRTEAAFRSMITALRLYKSGGVALGPHAWTRVAGGRWRRISTGAGKPRPGGYRLAEADLADLAAISRAIHSRLAADASPRPAGGLERAIARFEAGLERTAAIDALNDYLLSLRFLLEGGGPADLSLSMRVASLCADPDGRSPVKAVIDRAVALERELWSGEPPSSGTEGATPALEVEELARAILTDAACGHLGQDLRATADEILLADGLAVGDGAAGQRGETAEWCAGAGELDDFDGYAEEPDTDTEAVIDADPGPDPALEPEPDSQAEPCFDWNAPIEGEPAGEAPGDGGPAGEDDGPRYGRDAPVVPVDDGPGEPWAEAGSGAVVEVIRGPRRITLERAHEESTVTKTQTIERASRAPHDPETGPVARLLALRSEEREATASRVANLFPAPETTEWNVREIAYDRTRRSQAGDPQAS